MLLTIKIPNKTSRILKRNDFNTKRYVSMTKKDAPIHLHILSRTLHTSPYTQWKHLFSSGPKKDVPPGSIWKNVFPPTLKRKTKDELLSGINVKKLSLPNLLTRDEQFQLGVFFVGENTDSTALAEGKEFVVVTENPMIWEGVTSVQVIPSAPFEALSTNTQWTWNISDPVWKHTNRACAAIGESLFRRYPNIIFIGRGSDPTNPQILIYYVGEMPVVPKEYTSIPLSLIAASSPLFALSTPVFGEAHKNSFEVVPIHSNLEGKGYGPVSRASLAGFLEYEFRYYPLTAGHCCIPYPKLSVHRRADDTYRACFPFDKTFGEQNSITQWMYGTTPLCKTHKVLLSGTMDAAVGTAQDTAPKDLILDPKPHVFTKDETYYICTSTQDNPSTTPVKYAGTGHSKYILWFDPHQNDQAVWLELIGTHLFITENHPSSVAAQPGDRLGSVVKDSEGNAVGMLVAEKFLNQVLTGQHNSVL